MALIKCKECGHTISDKALKCPKCGNPNIKEEIPSAEENLIAEEVPERSDTITPISNSAPKSNKHIIAIALTIATVVIIGIIYFYTKDNSSLNKMEISINKAEISTNGTTHIEETEPINYLTEDNLITKFLFLWKNYGVNREFVTYKNIEGYKIVYGDLNGDDYIDALINVFATASPDDKDDKIKSFIFCFLNTGDNYEFVSVTKCPSIYFVTNINDMIIYSKNYETSSNIVDYNFKLEGDKLAEIANKNIGSEDGEKYDGEESNNISQPQANTDAEYPEGKTALFKFLYSKIKYPTIAQENKIEGIVHIKFAVNKDGTLSEFEVAQSADKYLDKEALRVAKLLKNFIPATDNGKPIKSYYTIKLKFKLS